MSARSACAQLADRPILPGIKPALGNPSNRHISPYRKLGLVHHHEPEERFGVALLSFANQAAAFERISRSRFELAVLSSQAAELLALRRRQAAVAATSSRSACLTHLRIVQTWARTPAADLQTPVPPGPARPSAAEIPPGILGSFDDILTPSFREHEVSTKPGQVQKVLAELTHLRPDVYSRLLSKLAVPGWRRGGQTLYRCPFTDKSISPFEEDLVQRL